MKSFLFAASIFLSQVISAQGPGNYGTTVRENYPFQVIATGQAPGMKDGDYVFTSQADYVAFWTDVFGEGTVPAEAIHDGEMLLVLKHTRPSGGVSLILGPAVETTMNLLMPVKFGNPAFKTSDLNYDYMLVKLKDPHKPVVFLLQ